MFNSHNDNCFNGATALRPWRLNRNAGHDYSAAQLQWGHGSEAVETGAHGEDLSLDDRASMGPRL